MMSSERSSSGHEVRPKIATMMMMMRPCLSNGRRGNVASQLLGFSRVLIALFEGESWRILAVPGPEGKMKPVNMAQIPKTCAQELLNDLEGADRHV